MKGFLLRIVGGHRDPEVERQAREDLIDGQLEGLLRLRIADLEKALAESQAREAEAQAREAQLKARLALALVPDFMHTALRQRASAAQLERTRVIHRRDLRAPTEYVPRRYRP